MKRLILLSMMLMCWLAVTPVFAADDLCPDLDTEKAATPEDMAGVQADIDRLTLCVERAKLLKQLDDVAKQRADMLDKIKHPQGSVSTGLGIPMLPVGSLPPVSGVNVGRNVSVSAPDANPLDNAVETMQSLVVPEWTVRKIWGQGAAMRAQLSDGQGTLINVVKNDPLPDGSKVAAVSVKGVTVEDNGKTKDLAWEQAASADDSGKKKPAPVKAPAMIEPAPSSAPPVTNVPGQIGKPNTIQPIAIPNVPKTTP